MDITKLPKNIRKKYEDKVLKKAIEKTEYDLNKVNRAKSDISQKKYEALVARNIENIKQSHKEKTWKYIAAFTGISFVSNILRGNIAGAFGFGDDDDDIDV